MSTKFERLEGVGIGDVLYLRSGSPPLTVTDFDEEDENECIYVNVIWFQDGILHTADNLDLDIFTDSPPQTVQPAPTQATLQAALVTGDL